MNDDRDRDGKPTAKSGLHIDTGGGAFVFGNVNTAGGDFAGRDAGGGGRRKSRRHHLARICRQRATLWTWSPRP